MLHVTAKRWFFVGVRVCVWRERRKLALNKALISSSNIYVCLLPTHAIVSWLYSILKRIVSKEFCWWYFYNIFFCLLFALDFIYSYIIVHCHGMRRRIRCVLAPQQMNTFCRIFSCIFHLVYDMFGSSRKQLLCCLFFLITFETTAGVDYQISYKFSREIKFLRGEAVSGRVFCVVFSFFHVTEFSTFIKQN